MGRVVGFYEGSVMGALALPTRTAKPREHGLTLLMDMGIPLGELHHILDDYHDFFDVAKLGVGSGYITPKLDDKVRLYRSYGVEVYLGGTLFEKYFHQNNFEGYLRFLDSHRLSWIEISTGTIEIRLVERIRLIKRLSRDYVVLAEVGTKNTRRQPEIETWLSETKALLEVGCRYVIAEGRNSGNAGIYSPNGMPRADLIEELVQVADPKRLVFEAPTPTGRHYFVNLVGPNVNLGNISPRDVLSVESERLGLRYETFFAQTA